MGVMVHLQGSAPSASHVGIALALLSVIALVADYTRMLLLRRKMVRIATALRSFLCSQYFSASWTATLADRRQHLPTPRRETLGILRNPGQTAQYPRHHILDWAKPDCLDLRSPSSVRDP